MPSPLPPVIPQPFANAGTKNTIPNTSADPQRAEYAEGFPPLTMTPIASGGLPPLGPDVNGILYAITTHLYSLQGGALQPFSSAVSTAIGGYNLGALVAMADGAGWWINLLGGNTADPAVDGTNWRPVYAYGPAAISGLTTGVRTLTPVEASRPFLILTGTLTGNVQIEVPPDFQMWLVINATTGAHTVTVKTPSGTGVVVPQGGAAAPSAVYCDGTNVQMQFSPTSLPTSVTPTPDTIALRDNLGFLFSVTPAAGDSTTKVATTQFVNPGNSLVGNGYAKLPGGLIIQWGNFAAPNTGARSITFPLAFPNNAFAVVPSQGQSANYGYPFAVTSLNSVGFTTGPAINGITAGTCYYIAIGY